MSYYSSRKNFQHNSATCTGILLANLGTPTAPTRAAVKQYLAEFLWDPRVVEIPRPIWWLILHGFILQTRPSRSAKLYKKIWLAEGSPLLVYSRELAITLEQTLAGANQNIYKVALGMRYGEPSIRNALQELREAGAEKIIVLPIYPQYAASTTGSIFDAVSKELQTWRYLPEIHFINGYADNSFYIKALVNHIQQHWQTHGKTQHLLFSFHGLPKKMLEQGDPYYCFCQKTARLVATQLNLASDDWSIAFQSRLGVAEWLKPYCAETLQAMPANNIKSVSVICPGFAVDCLETLEEIAITNRELFLQAGGERFDYIPALNASEQHVNMLVNLILQK